MGSDQLADMSMSDNGEWIISGVQQVEAERLLRTYAPWRMEIKFEGTNSESFGTYQPFNRYPLRKLREILKVIPENDIRGGHGLDVGFNLGYNSLYLAKALDMSVTGIDIVQKHKVIAEEIALMIGAKAEFVIENAETFQRLSTYNLVLHLGTLYHLANPVMSIDNAVRSLKRGGWFALETMCFRGSPDPNVCEWIYGLGGDNTNFWSLGQGTIQSIVARSGIKDFQLIFEAQVASFNGRHSRTIWVGKKG